LNRVQRVEEARRRQGNKDLVRYLSSSGNNRNNSTSTTSTTTSSGEGFGEGGHNVDTVAEAVVRGWLDAQDKWRMRVKLLESARVERSQLQQRYHQQSIAIFYHQDGMAVMYRYLYSIVPVVCTYSRGGIWRYPPTANRSPFTANR
jgi:hypothetical protein